MSLTLLEIVALTGIFTLAGTVKGAIGLGLPTVSMGLLSLMMPPGQAAALLLLPSLITNLWQLLCGPRLGALCRRLWPMMLCVTLGTLLSAGTLTAIDGRLAPLALGICLTGYALLGFTRFDWRVSAAAEPWLGPLCGLLTGMLTGATGVFVIPAVPYLNALGLARDDLVQALGLSFTVSTLALAAGLAWHQALPGALLGVSLLALLPALAGMWLGGIARRHSSPLIFRRLFFIGLLILGVEIIWRSIN
ncbi:MULTISPECIES: sulfite exporter TauE/SafE family protein [Serratia]|uniref:sulfite exporter TauE/SafE family protein n=1 Tax=Serratia TaxID=613 RepID=UPI000745143F|nr:sulfite exporter TauE/SafE family protein [Serratia marcescens]CVD45792.1 Sulfite exporter TauE/SafE [Serratia marcescens]CVF19922.1 Sulfite exporter TauE/SafE [Serratia marcescens]